jgi:hypothetical protein
MLSDVVTLVLAHRLISKLVRNFGHICGALLLGLIVALAFPVPPRRKAPESIGSLSAESLISDTAHALPQERDLVLELTGRVLLRLEQSEKTEIDPHFRDDIRIAWITTLFAARGETEPHVAATYRVLGMHPEKVWPAIVARRKAMLGTEYENFFEASGPKKPVRSVSLDEEKKRRDRAA